MEQENDLQFQCILKSQCPGIKLAETEVYVPSSANVDVLSTLSKAFVGQKQFEEEVDFLVDGKLLRDNLFEHFKAFNLNTEKPVVVEIIIKKSAPEKQREINADDWVSSIAAINFGVYFGCCDGTISFISHKSAKSKSLYKCLFPVLSLDIANYSMAVASKSSLIDVVHLKDSKNSSCAFKLQGHSGPVNSVSFEQSGQRLASVGEDGMLKIWSTQEKDDFMKEDEILYKRIKSSDDNAKETAKNRAPLVTLSAHQEPATKCLWCREEYISELLTAGFDNTLKVYDLNSLKPRASFTRDRPYNTFDRSLKNFLVATACFDTKVRIYDVRSDHEINVIQSADAHDELVSCVKWSPDDENLLVSGSYDSLVKMWDVRSPRVPLYDISCSEGKVLSCDWNQDSIFFGGEDSKLYRYSA